MSALDRDPELAKERAYESEVARILEMSVADFIAEYGTVHARIMDIASGRNLSAYVGLAHITVDLQSLIEAVAQAEVDK